MIKAKSTDLLGKHSTPELYLSPNFSGAGVEPRTSHSNIFLHVYNTLGSLNLQYVSANFQFINDTKPTFAKLR